jgi:ABC-type glycerol-3-phosphate transport system substrate-binding protein
MKRDNWDLKANVIPPYEESYWKGKVNGMPRGGSGQNGFVYNVKLFDKMGVPHPTNDWTSEQFLEIAKKLTVQENGKTVQWGTDWPSWDQGMLWSNGGDFSDKDYTKCTLDAPEAIEYHQWKQDLMLKLKVCPTPAESKTITGDAFATGKVAMSSTGFWGFYDYVKLPDLDFGFVATPKFKGKQVGFSSLSVQSMWKNAKNRDAAWEYMKYLTTPEVTWGEQQAGMWLSISPENSKKEEFLHPKGPPHDNSASIPGMLFPGRENWFTTLVRGTDASKIYNNEVLDAMANGKGTAADILKAVTPKLTPLVQGGATMAP